MPNSPCGVRWRASLPPTLMQLTEAGLGISVAGILAEPNGLQPPSAKARAQSVAICDRCI